MSEIDRRHFLMSSVALPAALKASALQSQNNTVRVAVVGFNGRGRAHISAYLKIPNVEIAALCDVDGSVMENGCRMIEKAGKKRPATYSDFRKLLEDKTIDAVSLATPNFHHAWQTKSVGYRLRCDLRQFNPRTRDRIRGQRNDNVRQR